MDKIIRKHSPEEIAAIGPFPPPPPKEFAEVAHMRFMDPRYDVTGGSPLSAEQYKVELFALFRLLNAWRKRGLSLEHYRRAMTKAALRMEGQSVTAPSHSQALQ